MYLIVFVHEAGHIFFGYLFDYKVKKINIYTFGGITIFESNLNNKFISDLLVALGGVIFQLILFLIVKKTDTYAYKIFLTYNTSIMFFNLIPIVSLDGGKIVNAIINHFIPYKKALRVSIYISYIFILLLLFLNASNINMVLIIVLLIVLVSLEFRNLRYIFNSFILERYIKNIKFKNNKFINGNDISKIMKYRNNIFIIDNKYYSEKDILYKFDK